MDQFWRGFFRYGIDQLTQGEAGHLKNAETVDAIRRRIAVARDEGFRRLHEEKVATVESGRTYEINTNLKTSKKNKRLDFGL